MGAGDVDGGGAGGAGAFAFDADMLSEVRAGCNTSREGDVKQRGSSKTSAQLLKDPREYWYLCDFLAAPRCSFFNYLLWLLQGILRMELKGAINSRASYNRALLKLV